MSPKITIEAEIIYGWRGYRISSEKLSLGIVPVIGGRVISLQFEGQELFFVQKEHAGETFLFREGQDFAATKRQMGFRLWGGDKTWVAPQSEWSEGIPPLVLDAGRYQSDLRGNRLLMQSDPDPETGLAISREISLDTKERVTLKQSFQNCSQKTIKRSIWNVSQVLRPVRVFLPLTVKQVVSYPEEGDSTKLKSSIVENVGDSWCYIRCDIPAHFKYGARPEQGLLFSLHKSAKGDHIVMQRNFSVDMKSSYAHDSIVEVYNSPTMNYAEVEVHAPLKEIAPGERVEHTQVWTFRRLSKPDLNFILATHKI